MAKKKGNKEMLKTVNYSLETVKKIKEGHEFTQSDKEEILNRFTGLSEDNNSYFTPYEICRLMVDCLDIKGNSTIADLSGGIGNMVQPLIETYGKLKDNVKFDLFELDENTSLAATKCWEDYKQVNYRGNVNTLDLDIGEEYDFIIGNPPFSGTLDYETKWNVNSKGKSSKKNDLLNSFIDKSFKCCKDNGYVALILPGGVLFKSGATEKLRNYLSERYDLKLMIELNPETFSSSGLNGTTITTYLVIWQKCKTKNNKTMIVELNPKDNLQLQLNSIPTYFQLVQKQHYIQIASSSNDKLYGILKEGVDPETIATEEYEVNNPIGECYCCSKILEESDLAYGKSVKKSDNEEVLVCFECENDELIYLDKIRRDLIIDDDSYELTQKDEKYIKKLKEIKRKEDELTELVSYDKNIYICTNNARDTFIDEWQPIHTLNFVKSFQGVENDNSVIKIKIPYIFNKSYDFSNKVIYTQTEFKKKRIIEDGVKKFIDEPYQHEYKFDKLIYTMDNLNIEHYKARKDKSEQWQDRERHIYSGHLDCGSDFYNTTFSIIYYPHEKRASTYVDYNFICSMSHKFAKPIKDVIIPDLLGDVTISR